MKKSNQLLEKISNLLELFEKMKDFGINEKIIEKFDDFFNQEITVKFKKLREDAVVPFYATEHSAGLDLVYIDDNIVLKPLERVLVSTGIAIELPVGYEAQIRPRSGLALKKGLTVLNSPGTIDSDYRGEIKVLLINLSDKEVIIEKGDRIAQMVISDVVKVKLKEVSEISSTKRNDGGFGSTGSK